MPRMAHGRPEPWLTGDIPTWCCVGMPVEPFRPPPRLLDRVRDALRLRHWSRLTERAYLGWIRRLILFHGKRHPAEMGAEKVSRFLSSLAVAAQVSASTQNQALAVIQPALRLHFERVRPQHERDVRAGAGWVPLPAALARKYPRAGREQMWQWGFPATRPYTEAATGQPRRHHVHASPRRSSRTATPSGRSRSCWATAT